MRYAPKIGILLKAILVLAAAVLLLTVSALADSHVVSTPRTPGTSHTVPGSTLAYILANEWVSLAVVGFGICGLAFGVKKQKLKRLP